MDKDFEIEIVDENTSENKAVQLPMNFLAFGEIENDDVKVYIRQLKSLQHPIPKRSSEALLSVITARNTARLTL